jgi:hypothetical protein
MEGDETLSLLINKVFGEFCGSSATPETNTPKNDQLRVTA